MFRTSLLVLVVVCLAAHGTSASSTIAKRDILSLLLGEESGEAPGDSLVSNLGDLTSVVLSVKNQIREIFEDIFLQCLKQILDYLCSLKVRLLKRIGQYTLANVFHFIFDGVTEFVSEENVVVETENSTTEEPSYQYKHPYMAPHVVYGK